MSVCDHTLVRIGTYLGKKKNNVIDRMTDGNALFSGTFEQIEPK